MYSEKYKRQLWFCAIGSGFPKFESRYSMLFLSGRLWTVEGLLERDEQTNEWIQKSDMNGNVIVALKLVREID